MSISRKRSLANSNHSPSKSSPLASQSHSARAKGKGKASTSASGPARKRIRTGGDDSSSEEDDDGGGEEGEYLLADGGDATNGQSISALITASAGDKYLLHSAVPSKTSNALLSDIINPAFTFESYASSLRTYDSSTQLSSQQNAQERTLQTYEKQFPKWTLELAEGFNILLYGFGSKRGVLNRFAESARKEGNVIVANGYDTAVSLPDIVEALEGIIGTVQGVEERGESHTKKGKKGKGKAGATSTGSTGGGVTPVPISAIEGRVRRVCQSLSEAHTSLKDVYLVIHNLDSPTLRLPKTLSLLALLASQPRLHLIASVDHLRAALIFPTSLATGRPTFDSSSSGFSSFAESRTFTFVHHEVTTLIPYTVENSHSALLSTLLPPSIFPRMSSSQDPTSNSISTSITYILASVTLKSRKVFKLLATFQLESFNSLLSSELRSLLLNPPVGSPSPVISTNLSKFKDSATDKLLASNNDQVVALLAEFKDHGVIKFGDVPPLEQEDGSGEWIWIPVAKEALEEIVEAMD